MFMQRSVLLLLFICTSLLFALDPMGFQGARWGDTQQEVQNKANIANWKEVNADKLFPNTKNIKAFKTDQTIASYKATTYFYFYKNKLFQATIDFNFNDLEEYDFNYNVFISVDKYYREIRSKTKVFVNDIYVLLRNKYGKKQPQFKGIAPHNIFNITDNYVAQERWNLRYNPSEYYKRIIANGYARWLYPKTEIIFAITISAADKRFDYTLSYTSLDVSREIKKEIQKSRSDKL